MAPPARQAASTFRLELVQQEVGEGGAGILPVIREEAQNAVIAAIEAVLVIPQRLATQFETVPPVVEAQVIAILKIVVGGIAVVGPAADTGCSVAHVDGAQSHHGLAAADPEFGVTIKSEQTGQVHCFPAAIWTSEADTGLVHHVCADGSGPVERRVTAIEVRERVD